MRSSWIGLALLSGSMGLAIAACGGSDTNGTGGGGGGATPIPLDDVPAKFANAFCSIVDTCFEGAFGLFAGGADCVTEIQREFEDGDFPNIKAGVDAGTVKYHGELTQACIDALLAEGCDALTSRMPAECQAAVEGTVAEGGDCTFNAECASGNYCKVEASCPGKCAAPGPADTPCTADDACQSGLLCDKAKNKCYAPAASGATCGDNLPSCAPNLTCSKAENASTGTCESLDAYLAGSEGDACAPLAGGPICKPGLACTIDSVDTSTTPASLVWKCTSPVASGADCNIGIPDPCPSGEFCDADLSTGSYQGKCQQLPTDGQPCQVTALGKRCATYNVCDANDTCQEIQRLGGSCGSDSECYSGNCASSVCAAKSDCP